MNNVQYLLALHSVDGLGPIRLKALIDFYKDPKLAWEAEAKELKEIGIPQNVLEKLSEKRRTLDPNTNLENIQKMGIKWVSVFDETYPEALKQIYDPPIILYYKGDILPQDSFSIAIVGTRKMTGYGKLVTEKFTSHLVKSGFTVVSGLARGVDSTAHLTALEVDGRTLAVLGGGLNHIYPPENIGLVTKIIGGKGAVMSEYPPDVPSLPGNFPSRNRIISGLSKAVLVTEADIDSGSLITARVAIEQGKDVFAIPGPITSALSSGPTQLIKEGARIVMNPDEILEEMGIDQRIINVGQFTTNNLSEQEKNILISLQNESRDIDELCRELKLPTSSILATLLKMEIGGLIRNLGNNTYCRV